jgi:hypothetical protein
MTTRTYRREKTMTDENACGGDNGALEHLHKAEQNLESAIERERQTDQNVAEAKKEVEEAIQDLEHPQAFRVEVIYDGVRKPFEVRLEETVNQLLAQAISAFGPLPNPHTLALFKDGRELLDAQTIKDAGIKPCDVLLLRPSTVKGGA